MEKLVKYNEIFKDCFKVAEEQLNEELVYQSVPLWDSVGHMGLISDLEDAFDIMLETDDVIEFSGYVAGKAILSKYGVEL